jgi:aromatic ring-opening dioxygenase catalytic subunit (LigB family)
MDPNDQSNELEMSPELVQAQEAIQKAVEMNKESESLLAIAREALRELKEQRRRDHLGPLLAEALRNRNGE